jgi:hypothetical protein
MRKHRCPYKRHEGTGLAVLTSTVDAVDWSASRTERFTTGERASGARWVGSRAGLVALGPKQSLAQAGNKTTIPRLSSP